MEKKKNNRNFESIIFSDLDSKSIKHFYQTDDDIDDVRCDMFCMCNSAQFIVDSILIFISTNTVSVICVGRGLT